MSENKLSRRTFMIGTAAAVAGSAWAQEDANTVLPRSERLNIAAIGLAGQGGYDVRQANRHGHNIVALCDVDFGKAAKVFEAFPKAKRFKDYRVMLDKKKNIDAVIVATPDHHHVFASMAALELGKHVYCEKPLTHSVYEARRLAEAAKRAGVATQMGNTGQASDDVRTICESIGSGAIGPVREVHAWTDRPIWPQGVKRPEEVHPVPDELDWDLWLGPAPERPFNRIYHPFRWRGWWDFGTGALGDMGCHRLDCAFRALKLGHPSSVEASASTGPKDSFPLASIVRYSFPGRGEMPPLKLTWYDGGLKPPRPDGLDEGEELADNGVLYVGDKGTMLDSVRLPRSEKFPAPKETLPRSIGHWPEWFEACKGGAAPGSNFEFAGQLTEVVLLGNVALRAGRKIDWDGPNLTVTNLDEASGWVKPSYREGWTV